RLDEPLESFVLLGDDTFAVRTHGRGVDAVESGRDADVCRVPDMLSDFCGMKQGLGGDASAVQTGAADLVLLDQRHRLAQLGGTQSGGVSTATASEDDDVELVHAHDASVIDEASAK